MSQFPPKKVVAITPLAPQIDRGAPCSHVNPASQGTAFGSFAVPCEAGTCFLPVGNSKMKEQRPFRRRLFLRRHHHPPDREPIRSRLWHHPPPPPPRRPSKTPQHHPGEVPARRRGHPRRRQDNRDPSVDFGARPATSAVRPGKGGPVRTTRMAALRPLTRPTDRPRDRPGRPGGGARAKSGAGPPTSPDCWGRTAMTLDPPRLLTECCVSLGESTLGMFANPYTILA